MKKTIIFLIISLGLVGVIWGQSNTGTKKPTPSDTKDNRYSESASYNALRTSKNLDNKYKRTSTSTKLSLQNSPSDDDVIKIDSTLITVPVSVSNAINGLYVTDLIKKDFKIYENGIEQEIAYFGVSDKPLTVILLLDTSPSTEYKIEEIQEAATAFVNQLNPQDRVEVIKFNEKIRVLARATKKREKIYKAINKARFDGGTSLYDAVDFSLRERLKKVKGRKAIVLFTDGVDTTSEDAFYDGSVERAERSDTIIFPIFYDTYKKTFKKGKRSSVRELDNRKLGKMYLNELASLTGGRLIEPDSSSGGLNSAFKAIADELRHQYNIGYYPLIEGKPGQRKNLKVRIYRPNLNIRARDNYIVKTK